jgi:hypothetical protein
MNRHGLDKLKEAELEEMLVFANAAASIVTTRKGAMRSMPDSAEVESLAKSIMGIFSLDLSKPLQLAVEDWKEEYAPVI